MFFNLFYIKNINVNICVHFQLNKKKQFYLNSMIYTYQTYLFVIDRPWIPQLYCSTFQTY